MWLSVLEGTDRNNGMYEHHIDALVLIADSPYDRLDASHNMHVDVCFNHHEGVHHEGTRSVGLNTKVDVRSVRSKDDLLECTDLRN